jgi:hypothetical protein
MGALGARRATRPSVRWTATAHRAPEPHGAVRRGTLIEGGRQDVVDRFGYRAGSGRRCLISSAHALRSRAGLVDVAPLASATSSVAMVPIPARVWRTTSTSSTNASSGEQPRRPTNTPTARSITLRDVPSEWSIRFPTIVDSPGCHATCRPGIRPREDLRVPLHRFTRQRWC